MTSEAEGGQVREMPKRVAIWTGIILLLSVLAGDWRVVLVGLPAALAVAVSMWLQRR